MIYLNIISNDFADANRGSDFQTVAKVRKRKGRQAPFFLPLADSRGRHQCGPEMPCAECCAIRTCTKSANKQQVHLVRMCFTHQDRTELKLRIVGKKSALAAPSVVRFYVITTSYLGWVSTTVKTATTVLQLLTSDFTLNPYFNSVNRYFWLLLFCSRSKCSGSVVPTGISLISVIRRQFIPLRAG